jgi:hypothetical protein
VINWLERARREIPKMSVRSTANTAEIPISSVTAVRHPGESVNFAPSDSRPRRYSYRFRLHGNEGGGLYLSDDGNLERVRDCLARRYGSRLALVTLA